MSTDTTPKLARLRTRWGAIGAAIAVTLGGGGIGLAQASVASGDKPVTVTVDPGRALDTRFNIGLTGAFASATPRDLKVTGEIDVATPDNQTEKRTVIPEGASAALVNVTVVAPTDQGFLALRSGGAAGEPSTSTVNFQALSVEPNAATVALNADGELQVYVFMPTPGASANVLIDIVGYTTDHNHDDRYYTEGEVDTAVAAAVAPKADSADVYTKSQVDSAVAGAVAPKANSTDVYTKSQVDAAVAPKANSADVYTKAEVDAAVANSSGVGFVAGTNATGIPTEATVYATTIISAPVDGYLAVTGTTELTIPAGQFAQCALRIDAIDVVSATIESSRSTYANTYGAFVTAGDHVIDLRCSASSAGVVNVFAPWLSATFSANEL